MSNDKTIVQGFGSGTPEEAKPILVIEADEADGLDEEDKE